MEPSERWTSVGWLLQLVAKTKRDETVPGDPLEPSYMPSRAATAREALVGSSTTFADASLAPYFCSLTLIQRVRAARAAQRGSVECVALYSVRAASMYTVSAV